MRLSTSLEDLRVAELAVASECRQTGLAVSAAASFLLAVALLSLWLRVIVARRTALQRQGVVVLSSLMRECAHASGRRPEARLRCQCARTLLLKDLSVSRCQTGWQAGSCLIKDLHVSLHVLVDALLKLEGPQFLQVACTLFVLHLALCTMSKCSAIFRVHGLTLRLL